MSDCLKVPSKACQTEIEVKKSRFICHILPCSSKQQAKQLISEIRAQIPDSNHHCWAYQIGPEKAMLQACSDDGEPQGTAGRPMLNVLSHAGLTNVLAVVSRIFGGTKLGTGGLVRAYSQSVNTSLAQVTMTDYVIWQRLKLTMTYANENQIRHFLSKHDFQIDNTEHNAEVMIQGQLDSRNVTELCDDVARLIIRVQRLD